MLEIDNNSFANFTNILFQFIQSIELCFYLFLKSGLDYIISSYLYDIRYILKS